MEHALHLPLLVGVTLAAAAMALGATISVSVPSRASHLIRIGNDHPWSGWQVSLWWDRWLAGTRLWPSAMGSASLPLAGMFAGAEIGRAHVELQSLMRNSYAVFCLKKKNTRTSKLLTYTPSLSSHCKHTTHCERTAT